jgi:hypothetical protein
MGIQLAGIDLHTEDALDLIALLTIDGYVATADRPQPNGVKATPSSASLSMNAMTSSPSSYDAQGGLCDVRAVLLQEHVWRQREGLV